MKKKLGINKDKIINRIPNFIIILLMLVIAPLGVWLFVVKTKKSKRKIYNKNKALIGIAIFVLFLIGVGIYSKVKEIIELCSSGMSLDMISFIPDNLWLYILGVVICISYLIGAKELMKQVKMEKKYIKRINFNKETSLKKISRELSINIAELKENIRTLQSCGYLVPLEIDDKKNKIIYIEKKEQKVITSSSNKKIKINKIVQCPKCGAMVSLKFEEYVECDFCGYGLIEENNG